MSLALLPSVAEPAEEFLNPLDHDPVAQAEYEQYLDEVYFEAAIARFEEEQFGAAVQNETLMRRLA